MFDFILNHLGTVSYVLLQSAVIYIALSHKVKSKKEVKVYEFDSKWGHKEIVIFNKK